MTCWGGGKFDSQLLSPIFSAPGRCPGWFWERKKWMRISKARRSKRRGGTSVRFHVFCFFSVAFGVWGWESPRNGQPKILVGNVLDANSWFSVHPCRQSKTTKKIQSSIVYPKYKLVPKPLMRREKYLDL